MILAAALLAACGNGNGNGSENGSGSGGSGEELVVYSGRSESLVDPILKQFEKDSGIKLRIQYADTSELTPTLLEEGENSPADLFFSQDAGALAALANEGLLADLPADAVESVDERFRDPGATWVGVTGRARVIGYNTDKVTEADLPKSVFDVTDPKWKGRVGFPPTNASFVSFVSALIESVGRDRTKQFLEGLKANDAKRYDNNVLALKAVAAGEVDLALVNHYYLYANFKDQPNAPLANHYPGQDEGGEGTFVNVAGVGVLESSKKKDAALKLVRYLLDVKAQEYFRDKTSEYPLRSGIDPIAELPPLANLKTIDVPLTELGRDLRASTELLKEVGLT
ncbi:MAG TPA: iron ABC transporter substrate-binding protein [Acidimicrobiales bacterium]|nr:iron ABC transporter substrate-binding protein [Acidimicrobiales bacterium]